MTAFWTFLVWVNTLSPGHACTAVTQSTHSVPGLQYPIVYGGSCAQAFRIALASHGSIGWIIGQ